MADSVPACRHAEHRALGLIWMGQRSDGLNGAREVWEPCDEGRVQSPPNYIRVTDRKKVHRAPCPVCPAGVDEFCQDASPQRFPKSKPHAARWRLAMTDLLDDSRSS